MFIFVEQNNSDCLEYSNSMIIDKMVFTHIVFIQYGDQSQWVFRVNIPKDERSIEIEMTGIWNVSNWSITVITIEKTHLHLIEKRKMRNEDSSLLSYLMIVNGISRIDIKVTITKKSTYYHLRIIHCKEDR